MKNTILLLFILATIGCKSQSMAFKKVENNDLNTFIGSSFEYKSFELSDSIIKMVLVTNPSGSAGNSESDEISNSIYISNCENGELLECKLYNVENLIRIKIESVTEDKLSIIIKISYGNHNSRETNTISIPKNN